MLVRRIITIIFFLGMLFLYFQQTPTVIDGTSEGVPYRIEIDDSVSFFYYQCPTITWDFPTEIPTVYINDYDYDPVYSDTWCPDKLTWEIVNDTGERVTVVTTTRTILAQSWGVLLIAVFFWLMIGNFYHLLQWDRLAMFSTLWAYTYLMHLISYEYFRTTFYNGSVITLLPVVASLLVLMNPRSVKLLIFLAIAQLIDYYAISPYSSNHTLIMGTLNLLILVSLAIMLVRHRTQQFNRDKFYLHFATIVQGMVFILYFWAWFHKLNTSYVEPSVSCVINFYEHLEANYFFFPKSPAFHPLWIYSSILVEGGIPILLLFRRTRLFGILVGIGFHGVLGLITFRDFTLMMYSFYFVFLSVDALKHIKDLRPYILDYMPSWLVHALWACVLLVLFITVPGIRFDQFGDVGVFINIANVIIASIMVLYLMYHQFIKGNEELFARLLHPQSALMWIALTLIAINGAMPYIGFKTNNSFDMYSNLRVEAGSNHLLFPAYGQLFDYPNDLVEIIDSSDLFFTASAEQDTLFVFWDFRERVYSMQPDYVVFRRDDQEFRVESGNYESVLGERSPLWQRKIIIFQTVSQDALVPCSH